MNITLDAIREDIKTQVIQSLREDIGSGDITAQLIPADKIDTAVVVTREECVVCGQAWVEEVFQQLDRNTQIEWLVAEGDRVIENTPLCRIRGNTRVLLTGERTALNFLQTLSGVASKAYEYKKTLGESSIKLLDTRKTLPGLRTAQKYAVTIGGCHNHRIGLFDAFLIKENHIAACGSISNAIQTARKNEPNKRVEVEVENLEELREALNAKADIIMLDNFSTEMLEHATALEKGTSKYEVSGNLTQQRIAELAKFNIDYLSFGALTKHVQAVDLSMRLLN